jgi:hypothetical protein
LILCSSTLSGSELNELRTWTSQEGSTLLATWLESDFAAETARMRRDDGRLFTIQWSRLCADDQALLRSQSIREAPQSSSTADAEPAQSLPNKFKLKKVPEVIQKGNFCVPASAAMIAGYHGIKTDQEQIAQLSSEASISNEGTYPSDMTLAMEKLGLEGHTLYWKDETDFLENTLPAIRRALVESGPIYISFRPNVFGTMGHGCVITGYNDRRQEMYFYNPWGNSFEKEFSSVALQARGVVLFDPPPLAPVASETLIDQIQHCIPYFEGNMIDVANRLKNSDQASELIWCSRRDARDDKRFAENTARRDGRLILELAFRRNPAVLIPCSPDGHTQKYYFVTRPPEGANYLVREITTQGWSEPSLKTLGSLTREWTTAFTLPDQTDPVWELPLIELHDSSSIAINEPI